MPTQAPSKADLLEEIERIRAENNRLRRLIETQRPDLPTLRRIEVAVRDLANQLKWEAAKVEAVAIEARELLATDDDLPSVAEVSGCLSPGADRVRSALVARAFQRQSADAVDPVAASQHEPTTRVSESCSPPDPPQEPTV